jgi:tRNA(His) guanylyltransferase
MADSLGDRMKGYENVQRTHLMRRTPVIVRVDGRAFHTYTKGFDRPFDNIIINTMVLSAMAVAKEMQGFKLAYVQSDEASFLLTDWDQLQTEAWFDNNLQKIVSIAAATMSVNFNRMIRLPANKDKLAVFDARAFNVPREDVSNYFLWRAKDWARNSVQMLARSHFPQKELQGKGLPDIHEMLHSVGVNWATDLRDNEKNGTFITADLGTVDTVTPLYANVDAVVEAAMSPATPKSPDE